MSSFVRRLQIKIWQRQGKKPFNHNGPKKKVKVPNTGLTVEININKWPLLAKDFIKEETASE
jgi:hypothetical protein